MENRGIGFMFSLNSKDKGTEKVSVNMNPATLSGIDLLVDNGYYSNRSDFINQAVRETLSRHQTTIDRIAEQNISRSSGSRWFLGAYYLRPDELDECERDNRRISIAGYGVLHISADCDDEKVIKHVSGINVKGRVNASTAIKAHYGLK